MLAIASSFFFPERMRNGGKINSGDLRGRQTFVLEVILIVSDFHKELLREKKKHITELYSGVMHFLQLSDSCSSV